MHLSRDFAVPDVAARLGNGAGDRATSKSLPEPSQRTTSADSHPPTPSVTGVAGGLALADQYGSRASPVVLFASMDCGWSQVLTAITPLDWESMFARTDRSHWARVLRASGRQGVPAGRRLARGCRLGAVKTNEHRPRQIVGCGRWSRPSAVATCDQNHSRDRASPAPRGHRAA